MSNLGHAPDPEKLGNRYISLETNAHNENSGYYNIVFTTT